jgi:hypothetical protein
VVEGLVDLLGLELLDRRAQLAGEVLVQRHGREEFSVADDGWLRPAVTRSRTPPSRPRRT